MRCAFLVTTIPGFFSACIEALACLPDVEVLLLRVEPQPEAPFDPVEVTPPSAKVLSYPSLPPAGEALEAVEGFAPDVLVSSGWQIEPYRHVARAFAGRCLRVVLMDNQWLGTPKQWLGIAASRFYLHPYFDVAFLPGRNQEVFARKLGFPEDRIWRGAYSCDLPRFLATAAPDGDRRRSFMFVGRLVKEKGVDVLARAYAGYRAAAADPWELEVYGTGPLAHVFDGIEGVHLRGFCQPSELPDAYAGTGCFVLPSVFEPWGAVIHEAAASRLPVICTTACGAAPHLVEDEVSGYLVAPGDAGALAQAMGRITALDPAELAAMREAGAVLAQRYSPRSWAAAFRRRALAAGAGSRTAGPTSAGGTIPGRPEDAKR